MSDRNTMLDMLIKGQDNLNSRIAELADKIGQLVSIEAARAERESNQERKNSEFKSFIDENRDTLTRVKRWHKLVDSSMIRVVGGIVFAVVMFAAASSVANLISKAGVLL